LGWDGITMDRAKWLLIVPPVVIFKKKNLHSAHTAVFMCFVWI